MKSRTVFHTDGNLWPVEREFFAEIGIHGYGEIDTTASGGGFILGSSNFVLPGTPAENVLAIYDTAREYGRYR